MTDNNKSPLTIVYDLDGTLVDTAPDLIHTLNTVLKGAGLRTVEPEQIRHLAGQGAMGMLDRAIRSMGREPDPDVMGGLFDHFIDYYFNNLTRAGSTPYPHVIDVLDRAQRAGHLQAVCTNKFQKGAEQLLAELNLSPYFKSILGGNALAVKKPDPLHITETIRRAGGDRDHAVMVGDSRNDSAAAKAAGVPCVLVSYGYTDVHARDLGAEMVIDSFGQLPAAIEELTGVAL